MITKYVTRIFWGERLEWNLALTPEQVLLAVGAKNEGSWIERVFAPGIGARTGKHDFTLSKMSIGNLPMSGNGFVHVLTGRVHKTPTGSRVVAQFRLPIHVFIFATIWLGLGSLIGIGGGISNLYKAFIVGDMSQVKGAAIMFTVPLLGIAFLNLFRLLGAGNERALRAALIDALGEPKQ
jgi:hypothetical protein